MVKQGITKISLNLQLMNQKNFQRLLYILFLFLFSQVLNTIAVITVVLTNDKIILLHVFIQFCGWSVQGSQEEAKMINSNQKRKILVSHMVVLSKGFKKGSKQEAETNNHKSCWRIRIRNLHLLVTLRAATWSMCLHEGGNVSRRSPGNIKACK